MAAFWVLLDIDNHVTPTISKHSIVLDLDETLIHSFEDIRDIEKLGLFKDPSGKRSDPELKSRIRIIRLLDVVNKKGAGKHESMYFVMRPHLEEFLVFCFRYFKTVSVWSAGRRRYVRSIIQAIFSHIREPHAVFTYDECLDHKGECNDKPLSKLYAKFPDRMSAKSTFLLDDRQHNFDPNPENGVLIPPYLPVVKSDIGKKDRPRPSKKAMLSNKDNCLELFMKWLMKPEVINAPDIRELDKSDIFPSNMFIEDY